MNKTKENMVVLWGDTIESDNITNFLKKFIDDIEKYGESGNFIEFGEQNIANSKDFWYGISEAAGKGPSRLFHYTNEAGLEGILSSEKLNPSLKIINPKDVRYGEGQYLSDILPGTKTPAQLSREFLGIPFRADKYTNFVEIDVTGLNVIQGRPGVFVVPNTTPLDLTGRILSSGAVH